MKSLHGCAPRRARRLGPVRNFGGFVRQHGLGHIEPRVRQRFHDGDVRKRQEGKKLEKPLHVGVVAVDPVLIIFVRRGQRAVQPDGAFFRFAHLVAGRSSDEGKGDGLRVFGFNFADEFGAGQHVPPLVVAAHLQRAAVVLKKVEEVVSLEKHVVELNKIQPLLQPDFIAFRRQHPVDAEMASDVAQKFDVVDLREPIGVVEQQGSAVGKIDVPRKLLPDGQGVLVDLLAGQHLAHFRLAAGVADEARAAADQRDGAMAAPLHMGQRHDGHQAADMQTGGRGIEADITGNGTFGKKIGNQGLVRDLFDKASFL